MAYGENDPNLATEICIESIDRMLKTEIPDNNFNILSEGIPTLEAREKVYEKLGEPNSSTNIGSRVLENGDFSRIETMHKTNIKGVYYKIISEGDKKTSNPMSISSIRVLKYSPQTEKRIEKELKERGKILL